MPEGVTGYPRWTGPLSAGALFPVIAVEEIRRALRSMWVQMVLLLVALLGVVFLTGVQRAAGAAGTHTMDQFLQLVHLLPWGALAVAAVVGGPMLLEDRRQGALELYLSRAVTPGDYLAGKGLAVFALSALAIAGPGLLYYAGALMLFKTHPAQWAQALPGLLGLALLWAAMVTGLSLGLSCTARSSAGASIVLFGAFAVADVFVSDPLANIVRDPALRLLSPFAALAQQDAWLFGTGAPHAFPAEWGLAAWAALTALGWALVAWKHPRMGGARRARA